MNLQEYKQALKKQLLTFKWLDEKLIDEIVTVCKEIKPFLLKASVEDVVEYGFDWADEKLLTGVEWFEVWKNVQRGLYPPDKSLTQSEVQQLLHILRGQLCITSFHKDIQKEDAAERWEYCDKKDKFTANSFAAYSQIYTSYKQHMQEEKKLVNLITKLKGLK